MCGIFFVSHPKADAARLAALNALMRHRGPDTEGILDKPPFFMGFNRLSILDLSDAANQPFFSRSGKHAIVFNGEIYNYREIVSELKLAMRTTGDTELLIELYEREGEKMLARLNGMFAFVILNLESGAVFAARDRLGVKPLYVYERDGTLAMASEIAPLLELAGSAEVDEIGLRQYRKLRTFFNGHTLYKNIRFFPAAHYYKDGRYSRYWDLPLRDKAPPSDEELRALVETSVAYRCVSDVPVGCFLSGGLDSSIVTLLAKPSASWSIGLADSNEFEWADLVAKQAGTRHSNILFAAEDYRPLAREMILKRREPLSVPNEVLLYAMCREVRKTYKVVLCGEGADELFFGYDRIFRWAAAAPTFDLAEFDKRYSYSPRADDEIVAYALEPYRKAYTKPIDIVAAFFQTAHLHGLLRRLDNSSMSASVEAREPFVDYRLIEALAGVAFDYKMKDGVVKAPLKRLFGALLPPSILTRSKVGFPVPLDSLFGPSEGGTPFDRWTAFNLATLGISVA